MVLKKDLNRSNRHVLSSIRYPKPINGYNILRLNQVILNYNCIVQPHEKSIPKTVYKIINIDDTKLDSILY